MEEETFYNLSNDYLFKNVFYHYENLSLLLYDFFKIDITGFEYYSPVLPKKNKTKANGETDLVLKNEKEIIIVEMQNWKNGSLENRSMIYLSKLYGMQWKKKDKKYEEIKPVTLYWFLNYRYGEKELLEYRMLETELYQKFGDNLKVKIGNIQNLKDRNEKYHLLFHAKKKEELEKLESDSKFGPIVKEIIKFNSDEKEYERIEATVDMWTREDEIQFTRMEAHREGRIEGEKIGILETASKLLSKGLPIELIMEVTNLSKKEIQKFNKVKN